MQFASLILCTLSWSHVPCHCTHVSVNHAVGVSFPALAPESAMVEASIDEHLPDHRVPPVVANLLRKDFNVEIIVSAFENGRHSELYVPREAHQIRTHTLVRVIESALIVFALPLAEGDQTPAVPAPYKDTSVIDSVQSSHIGHTV